MPCYTKNINKDYCENIFPLSGIHESCEQMGKYACDHSPECCYWKWSTGDIVGFVIAGLAGLFCIVFVLLYIRKYHIK